MTSTRAVLVLLVMASVGLAVVALRAEGRRLQVQAAAHRAALLEQDHQAWTLQLEIARLCAPVRICDRVACMEVNVGPAFDATAFRDMPRGRLASQR